MHRPYAAFRRPISRDGKHRDFSLCGENKKYNTYLAELTFRHIKRYLKKIQISTVSKNIGGGMPRQQPWPHLPGFGPLSGNDAGKNQRNRVSGFREKRPEMLC
jgi:hypothetical protein